MWCSESSRGVRSRDTKNAAHFAPRFDFVCSRKCCLFAKWRFPLAQEEQEAAAPRSETPLATGLLSQLGSPLTLGWIRASQLRPLFSGHLKFQYRTKKIS